MGPNDGPAALVMDAGMLGFGLTMILRPGSVRALFDRFADSWKPAGTPMRCLFGRCAWRA
jgi:hypothetical protein